eukprot:TRINITY_DN8766_c0_g1_i1.p2 TRINITY_DN8766_c0_g1~~TRINITY_DN8766_c0_g1_i1.p2  ORF type:complete len:469 (+),score=201.67 TRINITY_DN8766_c0_g1_i1:75-1481(+)
MGPKQAPLPDAAPAIPGADWALSRADIAAAGREEEPEAVHACIARAERVAALPALSGGGAAAGLRERTLWCARELRELAGSAHRRGLRFAAAEAVGVLLPLFMVAEEVATQPDTEKALQQRRAAAAEIDKTLAEHAKVAALARHVGDNERWVPLREALLRGWEQRTDLAAAGADLMDRVVSSLQEVAESTELRAEVAERAGQCVQRQKQLLERTEADIDCAEAAELRLAQEAEQEDAEAAAEAAELNAALRRLHERQESLKAEIARLQGELAAAEAERASAIAGRAEEAAGRAGRAEQLRGAARQCMVWRKVLGGVRDSARLALHCAEVASTYAQGGYSHLANYAAARLAVAQSSAAQQYEDLGVALGGLLQLLAEARHDAARRAAQQRAEAQAERMRLELAAETFDAGARRHASGCSAALQRAAASEAELAEHERRVERRRSLIARTQAAARTAGRVWEEPRPGPAP